MSEHNYMKYDNKSSGIPHHDYNCHAVEIHACILKNNNSEIAIVMASPTHIILIQEVQHQNTSTKVHTM